MYERMYERMYGSECGVGTQRITMTKTTTGVVGVVGVRTFDNNTVVEALVDSAAAAWAMTAGGEKLE